MSKKIAAVLGAAMISIGLAVPSSAATVVNGKACPKVGASTTFKVNGVSKTYLCRVNPSVVGATNATWTLKTCITYWAAAAASQKSIDDQLALVKVMSEPDKTTYTNQLADSQKKLDTVKAAIIANHCKVGL